MYSVLQIRSSNMDNLGIIGHIFPIKTFFCDPPLEPSHRDGSNEGSQHVFLGEIRKIICELSSVPPLIWRSGITFLAG